MIDLPVPAERVAANFRAALLHYEAMLGVEPNNLRIPLMARLLGTQPPEAYAIVQALQDTRDVPGDVCEFGVAQGETSALIANEIRSSASTLHLFDSFEGLSVPTEKDLLIHDIYNLGSMAAYAGIMKCPVQMVAARINDVGFPRERVTVHTGFVADTLPGLLVPMDVRFAYLDMDLYEPTRDALTFLEGVTGPQAVVIVDDYGFFSSGVKTAVDEAVRKGAWLFAAAPNEQGLFCTLWRNR